MGSRRVKPPSWWESWLILSKRLGLSGWIVDRIDSFALTLDEIIEAFFWGESYDKREKKKKSSSMRMYMAPGRRPVQEIARIFHPSRALLFFIFYFPFFFFIFIWKTARTIFRLKRSFCSLARSRGKIVKEVRAVQPIQLLPGQGDEKSSTLLV